MRLNVGLINNFSRVYLVQVFLLLIGQQALGYFFRYRPLLPTLQRQNAENLKQILPEKEYRGLSPNFNIHVSVSELYIPTKGLPVLLEEIWRLILGIYKSLKDT
jgi:hypothetical protein